MKRTDSRENKNKYKSTKLNVTLKQWQKMHFDFNLLGERKGNPLILESLALESSCHPRVMLHSYPLLLRLKNICRQIKNSDWQSHSKHLLMK